MELRRLVRGTISWERLEAVGRELVRRADDDEIRIRFLDADNWLSTPCVVDDRWFVKVVSSQNSLVHALFTTGRNIGAFSSGTEGFFERFDSPLEMVEHELVATRRMREVGVAAPEPVETFEVDGLGVLVFEYLPEFRTLDELDGDAVRELAPDLFGALALLHENGLAHGDLRAENVLVHEGELNFIDATNVREDGMSGARAYDVACALAVLAPLIGAGDAVEAALDHYAHADLLDAREFVDFVSMRPDHDFEPVHVKSEIEKRVA